MKKILALVAVMVMAGLPGYGQKPTAPTPAAPAAAQEQVPQQSYKLLFVVRETDERGKVLNTREYSALIAPIPHRGDPGVSVRTAGMVPISTFPGSSQATYQNIKVDFDINGFRILSPTRVALDVNASLSSIAPSEKADMHQTIRSNMWHGSEQLTLGKSEVIFSSDDLTSKNKMQVELMVTEVK